MTRKAQQVGVAEAKAKLSDLIRQVEAGSGPVVIERHGRPVAVLDAYRGEVGTGELHWASALDSAAADLPDFEASLTEIVAAREQSTPRPFDLD